MRLKCRFSVPIFRGSQWLFGCSWMNFRLNAGFLPSVLVCWSLSTCSFVFSHWQARSVGLISGDWLDHWKLRILGFSSLLAVMCTVKLCLVSFAAWGYRPVHSWIHPAVTSSINSTDLASLAAMHATDLLLYTFVFSLFWYKFIFPDWTCSKGVFSQSLIWPSCSRV